MSMEKLKEVWNSQTGKHSESVELERLAAKLDRSYRRERAMLTVCSLNTSLATVLVIWILFRQTFVNWNGVFPVVVVQVAGILALAVLLRRHMKRRRTQEWSAAPVREAVRHALADIEGEMRNIKFLAGAGLVMAPLLAIAVSQLHSSGKMDERAVIGFGILCAAVIAINALVMTAKYRRRLRPGRQRLKQILEAFEQDLRPS